MDMGAFDGFVVAPLPLDENDPEFLNGWVEDEINLDEGFIEDFVDFEEVEEEEQVGWESDHDEEEIDYNNEAWWDNFFADLDQLAFQDEENVDVGFDENWRPSPAPTPEPPAEDWDEGRRFILPMGALAAFQSREERVAAFQSCGRRYNTFPDLQLAIRCV